MQALRTTEPAKVQGRHSRQEFEQAWLSSFGKIDNSIAMAELLWHSMTDNDSLAVQWNTTQCRALDAVSEMLKDVRKFFSDFGTHSARVEYDAGRPLDRAPGTVGGAATNAFCAVVDRYNWALDAVNELSATTDKIDPAYDPSPEAKSRFSQAKIRWDKAECELVYFQPANLAELQLKIKTVCDLRRRDLLGDDYFSAVLFSLERAAEIIDV